MDVVTHFGLSQDPFATTAPGSLAGGRLTVEAARAYLAGRIAGAGAPDLFTSAALDVLAEASAGEADLLRRLGGSALVHAAFEGARRVEDQHARQAAVTQGLGSPEPVPTAPVAAAAGAAEVPVHGLGVATAAAAIEPDPIAVHRRWWRRTPPITRLAIIVGLLLLSLPVVGYMIGVMKDSQAADSSYLPEDSIVDAEKIAPVETDAAVLPNPDVAPAVAVGGRPAMPAPTPYPVVRRAPSPEPTYDAPIEAEAAPEPEPVPLPEPVPIEEPAAHEPQLETVPVDRPAEPAAESDPPTPQA